VDFLSRWQKAVNEVAPQMLVGILPANWYQSRGAGRKRVKMKEPLRELIVKRGVPMVVVTDPYRGWRRPEEREQSSAWTARAYLNAFEGKAKVIIIPQAHRTDHGYLSALHEIDWDAVSCLLEGCDGILYWGVTGKEPDGPQRMHHLGRLLSKLHLVRTEGLMKVPELQVFQREGNLVYSLTPNGVLVENLGDEEAKLSWQTKPKAFLFDVLAEQELGRAPDTGKCRISIPPKTTCYVLALTAQEHERLKRAFATLSAKPAKTKLVREVAKRREFRFEAEELETEPKLRAGAWTTYGKPIQGKVVICPWEGTVTFHFPTLPAGRYVIWMRVAGNWESYCPTEVSTDGGKTFDYAEEIRLKHRQFQWGKVGVVTLTDQSRLAVRLTDGKRKRGSFFVVDCFLVTNEVD